MQQLCDGMHTCTHLQKLTTLPYENAYKDRPITTINVVKTSHHRTPFRTSYLAAVLAITNLGFASAEPNHLFPQADEIITILTEMQELLEAHAKEQERSQAFFSRSALW
jgi:hypothetical protein